MTILTRKTLEDQAFPVLRYLSSRMPAIGRRPERIFMEAARTVADGAHIDPKTIRHLFMRRLGFGGAEPFYAALKDWAEGRPTRLGSALKEHAPANMHDPIDRMLALPPADENPPTRLHDTAAAPIPVRVDGDVVTLGNLDSGTLLVLRSMARQSGRSVEDEVKHLVIEALRARRDEAIRWADELRASLVGRYVGDSTADIRADRDRR